jgi:hypothetical protein
VLKKRDHIFTAENALYNLKHRSEFSRTLRGYTFIVQVSHHEYILGLENDEELYSVVAEAVEVAISQNHGYDFEFKRMI